MALSMITTPQLQSSCYRTVCLETMGEGRSGDAGLLLRSNSVRRISMVVRAKRVMYGSWERRCVVCCCRWCMSMIQCVAIILCGMRM